ncbi:acyltransferase [Aerococcus urinaeequi]|uniref:acyltransferase n=1 Tax=Aerococcus urinaeequi TaxID=51665 RepID=UPI003B4E489D
MYIEAKFRSLYYEIGEKCQFDNVKFLAPKKSIIIGDRVVIFRKSELCAHNDKKITIGNDTFINQGALIRPNTKIGNNVSIGQKVSLISDTHELGSSTKRAGNSIFPEIIIGDGCWIDANVTVIGGVKIGKGSVIGAGSVVIRDCEPNALYAGVPAKLIKYLD